MKILITLSYYLPNVSGLTKYVKNLSEELVEKYDVTVLTSKHDKNLPLRDTVDGVKIKRVWVPFMIGRGSIMPTYIFESMKLVRAADVVNVHLPQFEGFITSFWAKAFRKKLIVTYHCDLSFWGGVINIISTILVYVSNCWTCFLADKIVVNTKDYANNSWFLKFFKNKLVYIYPPVKVVKAKEGVLKKYKNVKYKIGYVGRISKEKGVDVLLKSVEYLKDDLNNFKVFFVGPKDVIGGGSYDELSNLIKKNKKHLVFLGKLFEEELSGFYKEIDCLVLPSTERQESFGMVQVEAMLNGCPVVATNLSGVRVPVQRTGMGEICQTGNEEDLSEKILVVLKKKKFLSKKVAELFSIKEIISKYIKIYK